MHTNKAGLAELRTARAKSFHLVGAVLAFSFLLNALMLTGPIFMMQVYDRVLGSRSESTLVSLFLIVTFLFLAMGIFDHVRGRVLARAGIVFQRQLETRIFNASLERTRNGRTDRLGVSGLRDLDSLSKLYGSPVALGLCDIPYAPLFFLAIFLLHPSLAVLALAGAAIAVAMTIANQITSRRSSEDSQTAMQDAANCADLARAEADIVKALGMRASLHQRWARLNDNAIETGVRAADTAGGFASASRTFRMYLQSAMLALGALLVLKGDVTGGAMMASSVLMGRALAPIDQIVGQWPVLQRAHASWGRLAVLLSETEERPAATALPRPKALIEIRSLAVVPPGSSTPVLRGLNFTIPPGKALGVIGSSGAGKSSLARALCASWPAASGSIRIDGASLDQYDPDTLGRLIGYLPQKVSLFPGTIAENIARMDVNPDAAEVVKAAQRAGAHDMILKLPQGYDTKVGPGISLLSGGQEQKIGLARALYGDPVLLILDEPNSNLDAAGSDAVNAAISSIKASGGSAIVIAHRPQAIACCEALLHIEAGAQVAFGARDQVLKSQVQNHKDIPAAKPQAASVLPAAPRPAQFDLDTVLKGANA
jgi:ATP-binding cassette, subfamily C, bacterial